MKKTISLETAVDNLLSCTAVIVDDSALVYPAVNEVTGIDTNEFLTLIWTDNEGDEGQCICDEGENKSVEIDYDEDGNEYMTLIDRDGLPTKIHLLTKTLVHVK
jgi:hypothetical protein